MSLCLCLSVVVVVVLVVILVVVVVVVEVCLSLTGSLGTELLLAVCRSARAKIHHTRSPDHSIGTKYTCNVIVGLIAKENREAIERRTRRSFYKKKKNKRIE